MRRPHVVIVGGGFAGLEAARRLCSAPVKITLIDRRNFHLFQPLLYQVATGGLSPANIAAPLRAILANRRNVHVRQAEVVDFDVDAQRVLLHDDAVDYDWLIVATGSTGTYFGNDSWQEVAPGLKTVEDALQIRRRVFSSFELAEYEDDEAKRRALTTFVIIGGGPTGVELAGALSELSRHTLEGNFLNFDPADSKIYLVEAASRLLTGYDERLSEEALNSLRQLGVDVRLNTKVDSIEDGKVTWSSDGSQESIESHTILWGAGVVASPLGKKLAASANAETDAKGRVIVGERLSVGGCENVFVLGDLAHCEDGDGEILPGVAPVAMQQGKYIARLIRRRLAGKTAKPFSYVNLGNMAVIGRAAAVAEMGKLRFHGFTAWLLWLFVHLINLVAFENRVLVLFQWMWNYVTRNRSARLVTNEQQLRPTDQRPPLARDEAPA